MPEICIVDESLEGEYTLAKSVTRRYNLKEYATRFAAEAALLAHSTCPIVDPDYSTLIRKRIQVRQTTPDVTNVFSATVTWEEFIPPQVDREILTGSLTTSTIRVKQTFNHIGSFGPGANAAMNAGGAINVTSNGVEGVDFRYPVLGFQIRRLYVKGTFTLAWLANAATFTHKPNSLIWRGFAPGEIMFDRCGWHG